MRDADNNNEPFTFQTLATATAKLLKPDEKQNEEGADNREREQRSERREKAHREYVEQRLRELAAFERRARGGKWAFRNADETFLETRKRIWRRRGI